MRASGKNTLRKKTRRKMMASTKGLGGKTVSRTLKERALTEKKD
jgi:hypothetical protein